MELKSEIKVVYTVSNKYFILTVLFACLIVLLLVILVTLAVLFKRKREEFRGFLIHKERKMKGEYKKYEQIEHQVEQRWNNIDPYGEEPDIVLDDPLKLKSTVEMIFPSESPALAVANKPHTAKQEEEDEGYKPRDFIRQQA